ncbi:uncharacterized protein AMSG_06030 [Thecamonas trahens ATCC 50062]|uniref:Uncharacterized protein n=1 Tax=Thecamonas trahens ATCC 50062 TaxID=461836 RepID=A0A0L0DBN4_THETB|nr:hypothetical protein AMSG_06030 [Thecamonas trahens ATCC 50062]KNC49754.1 hypothetical protein AMSG_06030 [Thecamonas trahens ATCC 50062]|eukprot:XP_013757540.1 hypothetical protein AMSG_06030 [Thecamonas trahens ATCC 50062]
MAEFNEALAGVVEAVREARYSAATLAALSEAAAASTALQASVLERLYPKVTGLQPLSVEQTRVLLQVLATLLEANSHARVSQWSTFVLQRIAAPDAALADNVQATALRMLASSSALTLRVLSAHVAEAALGSVVPGEGPVGALLRGVANAAPAAVSAILVTMLTSDDDLEAAASAGDQEAAATDDASASPRLVATLRLLNAIALDQGSRMHELFTPELLTVLLRDMVISPAAADDVVVAASVTLFMLIPLLPPLFVPHLDDLFSVPCALMTRIEAGLEVLDEAVAPELEARPAQVVLAEHGDGPLPLRQVVQIYFALLYGMFPTRFFARMREVFLAPGSSACTKTTIYQCMSRLPFNPSSLTHTPELGAERWHKPATIITTCFGLASPGAAVASPMPAAGLATLVNDLYSHHLYAEDEGGSGGGASSGGSSAPQHPLMALLEPQTENKVLTVLHEVEELLAESSDGQHPGPAALRVLRVEASLLLERFWCAMHKERVRLLSRDIVDSAEREAQNMALFRKVQSQRGAIQALHKDVDAERARGAVAAEQHAAAAAALKVQLDSAQARIATLEAMGAAKDVELEQAKQSLRSAEDEIARKNETLLSLKAKLATALPLLERQASYEASLESMSHELLNERAAELSAALKIHKNVEAKLQVKLAKAEAEIKLLQSFTSQATSRVSSLQTENASLHEAVERAADLLAAQQAAAEAAQAALTAKYESAKAINAALMCKLESGEQ